MAIDIKEAFYGIKDGKPCGVHKEYCGTTAGTLKVQSICNGHSNCTIKAIDSPLTDS